MSTISLQNISKRFNRTEAVRNVSVVVQSGEFLSILGPSGCGKTTLLRMIAGLEAPDTGSILLDGKDITGLPAQKRSMGMVFQNYALFPHKTVFGNIAFGLESRSLPREEIVRRVQRAADAVLLGDRLHEPVPHLSGGEQQRVAVARAIVIEPAVLLFDEPLSNLDMALRLSTREEIRAIHRSIGITTIYVTHDQSEAMSLSDRIAVMRQGRLEQVGTPAELYNTPSTAFVAGFLGGANIVESEILSEGMLRFGSQQVRLPLRPGLLPGRATVAIKPETITIAPSGRFEARVENVEFLGFTTNLTLLLDGVRLRATVMSSEETRGIVPGSLRRIEIDWNRCPFFQS